MAEFGSSTFTLNLTIPPESVVTGKQVTFKAPCDCTNISVGGITVNGDSYILVDSNGNTVTSYSSFSEGSIVSVILDCENKKAFIQNSNTNKYLEDKIGSALNPAFTEPDSLSAIISGENLSLIIGKISKLISDLLSLGFSIDTEEGTMTFSTKTEEGASSYVEFSKTGYINVSQVYRDESNVIHVNVSVISPNGFQTFGSVSCGSLSILGDSNVSIKSLGLQRDSATVKYDPTLSYGSNKSGNGYATITFEEPYKEGTKPTITVSPFSDLNPLEHALMIANITNTGFTVKYQHKLSSAKSMSFRWIAVGTFSV